MIKLFFDIETLPAEDNRKEEFLPILKRKARRSTPEDSDDELFLKTSLEGTFGRIFCIGYIKENGRILDKGVLVGDEKEMLQKFWQLSRDVELFVGHNIWEFDLPFIYKRSIILGVKPRQLNFARYRNEPIFDTMKVWELWSNGTQGLDTLAKVLGLPTSKDEMNGVMVWPYYQQGKYEEICKYCLKDVELTRKVYQRMVFEEIVEESREEEFV
jgi:predicted PolB exonuclease-like 3'-5' exonuclease